MTTGEMIKEIYSQITSQAGAELLGSTTGNTAIRVRTGLDASRIIQRVTSIYSVGFGGSFHGTNYSAITHNISFTYNPETGVITPSNGAYTVYVNDTSRGVRFTLSTSYYYA